MLDYIEYLESGATARLEEMTEGLPEGKFRCDCGNIEDLDHAAPSSDNPYASPMCRECLSRMLKVNEK
jgi:hypothetical protein